MITETIEIRLINCSLDKKAVEEQMIKLEAEYRRLATLENELIVDYIAAKENSNGSAAQKEEKK